MRTPFGQAPAPLPLWLAREQSLHTKGSFAGSEPRTVGVNFGGSGEIAAGMFGGTAEQLGVRVDYDREIGTFGSSRPSVLPEGDPPRRAVAKKPFTITIDFADMELHIARGPAG